MVTKLKNFSRQWYCKLTAYILIVVCTAVFLGTIFWQNKEGNSLNLEAFFWDSYASSNTLGYDFYHFVRSVLNADTEYESEEAIRAGEYAKAAVTSYLTEMFQEWIDNGSWEADGTWYNEYPLEGIYIGDNTVYWRWMYDSDESSWQVITEKEFMEEGSNQILYRDTEDEEEIAKSYEYKRFLEYYPTLSKEMEDAVISIQLREYRESKESMKSLMEENVFQYDICRDKGQAQKLIKEYSALTVYCYYTPEDSGYTMHLSDSFDKNNFRNYFLQDNLPKDNKDYYIFTGMKESAYSEKQADWEADYWEIQRMLKKILPCMAVVLLLFVYLILVTGRRPGELEVMLYGIDRIWSEVIWIAGGFLFWGAFFFAVYGTGLADNIMYFGRNGIGGKLMIALSIACGIGLLIALLTQVRRLKAKSFLNGFLCGRLVRRCLKLIKSFLNMLKASWKQGKISKRALFLAVILPLLCATWVFAPFVILFLVYMIYKHLNDFTEICEGASKIRKGQLNYEIKVKNEEGELGKLADDINQISQGLENAVDDAIRSEKLKSELISNVSHDLKTPLTSIVTYVDLLKKEIIENEKAAEYIDIIDRKAKRLTVLTTDLFEAAKASSGDMPVDLSRVDLNALVRQALGEFDEKMEAAGLEVKLTLPEQPSFIRADGRLTWRVIDNLLSNVVKYAQEGSRVYVNVGEEKEQSVLLTVKNISANELNIPADELMERFKRGDESRNSEGSGLGLSIANSLVDLQHGTFQIVIDGDLFKAEVRLPQFPE